MRVDRTDWDEEDVFRNDAAENTVGFDFSSKTEQPTFGVVVLWNRPSRWWQPCLVVHLWHWRVQIGWMVN